MNNYRTIQQKDMHKLFPAWEKNIPTLGTKYSQPGNKTGQRLVVFLLLLFTLGSGNVCGQITPTTDTSNPVYYLFQSFGNTSFYMRPNGTNVNTSNILTDDMKWYFLDSDESGYYYICDKGGNYLYFKQPSGSQNSRTWMELKNSLDNDDKAHYKFSIAKNNTKGWDAYNIIPYGNEGNYCLNKQGRNAGTGNVQVSNGWDDENSNWVFIPMTTYEWTLRADCFRPSDSSNKYFYQIKSKVNASYYIKPGTTYVETSNTVDDDMIWYFEEASSDDYMTYYYIRLANDGQYLKYRANGDNAIQLANHTGSETGDAEDCFQFIVVRGAVSDESYNTTDISYNIVPKLLKRTNDNINFFCVSSNKGLGKPLKIRNDRAATDNKWTFVSVDFPTICAKPTITFSNTTGKASITTTTTRSTIYYTTDGSEPSSNGTEYSEPFAVNEQTTIKAFVTRTDFSDSEVTTETIYKVATPTIENTEASVISITSATSGAQIYYTTDGSNPTTSSTPYTEPVTITASSVTIKAIAVKDGMINSAVSTESFAFACATPTISFDNTTNTVTIASETGSTIYYAYDSTDPADPTVDEGVAHGSSPVTFTISAKTYIKALAIKEGLGNSAVQSATIDKVSAPVIDITSDGKVKLTSSTTDVTIYYEIGDDASSVATPTTSSTRYTSPLSNVAGKVIKAIAVKDGWITSDIGGSEGPITLKCAMPVIRRGIGNTFTISCGFPAEGVHIYYTTGNGDPTTLYEGPVSIATYPITVKAVAKADGYNDSSLAEETITQDLVLDDGYYLIASAGDFEKFVTMANSTGSGDKYKVVDNFTVSGNTAVSTTFTGTFEGGFDDESGEYFTITGLRQPLFNSTNNAVIKNVILKNVSISSDADAVGAIACVAKGYTCVYNCGILPNTANFPEGTHPGVSTTGTYAGSIVGSLEDDSRVVNCFSYADVSATTAAGIVGNNTFASTAKETDGKYTELRTMVVNCMFYGNISATNFYPVYGGAKITNKGATAINNYNFYRNGSTFTGTLNDYNCSWPVKEEYLTHYEYYRYLLNSNRELCGWWVGAPSAPSTMLATAVQNVPKDASLMAKWVLDPSIAPYPILKVPGKYYSTINQDPDNRINPVSKTWESRSTSSNTITTKAAPDTEGQKLGSITVTINKGGSLSGSSSKNIPITAMDIENNDFCYGKIQLPYYNSIFGNPNSNDWTTRYGGNYGDQVVVGWEITSVTGGTEGTLVKDWQTGYNFADRDCTNKDKERIFAQGGYYYVPNGVSAITITAKWADAVYLDNSADHSYDRVYMSYNTNPNKNIGYHFAPAGSRPSSLGNDKTVQTASVSSKIPDGNVYEKAIVLVGNHQYRTDGYDVGTADKGCTIISADFDFDDEPDYCLEWQLGTGTNRQSICPIRFDFLPVIEIGMAMKEDGSTQYYSLGCYLPLGHFEVTETSLIHFGQFEFGNANRNTDAPLILNGGIFDQYCKGTKAKTTADDHIDYIILGGNVYMPSFSPGAHVNAGAKYPTRHCAVNVLGGRINNLYLTGNFNNAITPNTDNPHCYIDGGNFKQIAAAAKEGINGDVYFRINHSVINEFYGGSTLADKLVTGNINVTVDNSKITKYCGGPKFGNMTSGKTVTTNAIGTTFGVYYGGGNGGTSYVQYESADNTVNDVTAGFNWNTTGKLNSYTPNGYRSAGKNYMADYEMEIVNTSTGTDAKKGIFRTYLYAAQFSATNTGPISNNLTNCKVLTSFYGGGNLGGVIGDVESTLTDTEVMGSAFGAGYSASVPEVTIYNKDKTAPTLNVYTGIITPTPDPDPNSTSNTYTWCYKNKTTNVVIPSGVVIPDGVGTGSPTFEYEGKKYFYTEESLENLGTVTGKVTLNIEGTTTIKYSVYGGGEESGVSGDTEVKVTGGTIGTTGKGGAEYGNVYGGGKGKADDVNAGLVKGNTNVNISGTTETTKIIHNVYGGGAFGSVGTFTAFDAKGFPTACTENTGTANITITGGTFGSDGKENGMVFGSSRGSEGDPAADANIDKIAWVGNTNVVIGTQSGTPDLTNPKIAGSVYGGGENGHNYQNAQVTIHSGTIGITNPETDGGARYPYRGNVYGGGCGTDTFDRGEGDNKKTYYNFNAGIVLGNTRVDIDGGHIVHNVYGGGAMGTVGTYTLADDAYHDAHTDVPVGMPYECKTGTGNCTINITGGLFGMTNATMTGHGNDGPDDFGHIFGAGRGYSKDPNVYPNIESCAFFNNTDLTIGGTALVCGSVYGGSESGHVLNNTSVTISGGQIGCGVGRTTVYTDDDFNTTSLPGTAHWTNDANGAPYDQYASESGSYDYSAFPKIPAEDRKETSEGGRPVATDGHSFFGNVFGGGSGYYPYAPGLWLKSAGHIGGTATVTVSGGHILNNLYGGCEMADVDGAVTVTMTGGTVGVPRTKEDITANPNYGNVYGAGMGDKRIFFNTSTNVASATVNISNGTIYGSVFGGGEDGHVLGNATTTISQPEGKTTIIGCDGSSGNDGNVFGAGQGHVGALTAGVVGGNASLTVTGGTMKGSVYGGGRIASVGTYFAMVSDDSYGKMQEGDDHGNLSVSLTGGTINQSVYGGCMGTATDVAYGISKNVSVELNNNVDDAAKGCIVLGPIFGCNNVNSSPEGTSTVHIYKTQRNGASRITNAGEVTNAKVNGTKDEKGEFDLTSFDVPAVYGGGNLAAYTPKDANGSTNVIIDGCSRTSIGQVYGGGNAASTPATNVTVNGTFEIGELFGGGNGKDKLPSGADNPGANVGFKDYYAVENDERWDTKEERETNQEFINTYVYGTGLANVTVKGGTIYRVFGGSNTKGNVRKTALTMLEELQNDGQPVCEFHVGEAYGGGKSAPMDAEAKLLMACIPGLEEVYGGAQAADIKDNVTLTITNGTFDRVFGGNNLSGTISGSITVNVEEVGCRPIIIGELYGGGNLAAYSIYGYDADGKPKTSGQNPSKDPVVNAKSFTSIGSIYGGGYGEGALMVGSPTVNINEVADPESEAQNKTYTVPDPDDPDDPEKATTHYYSNYAGETKEIAGHDVILPSHVKGKIGAINNVFGGGNAAKVIGNTTVNIGTLEKISIKSYVEKSVTVGTSVEGLYTRSGEGTMASPYRYTSATGTAVEGTKYYEEKDVEKDVIGADIRGNVYGGGNNAEVTGDTNVNIGKKSE